MTTNYYFSSKPWPFCWLIIVHHKIYRIYLFQGLPWELLILLAGRSGQKSAAFFDYGIRGILCEELYSSAPQWEIFFLMDGTFRQTTVRLLNFNQFQRPFARRTAQKLRLGIFYAASKEYFTSRPESHGTSVILTVHYLLYTIQSDAYGQAFVFSTWHYEGFVNIEV